MDEVGFGGDEVDVEAFGDLHVGDGLLGGEFGGVFGVRFLGDLPAGERLEGDAGLAEVDGEAFFVGGD